MGTLINHDAIGDSDAQGFVIEDRALHHVQIAMTRRFRHGEGFFYRHTTQDGRDRAFWFSPTHSISIEYTSQDVPSLNAAWVTEMEASMSGDTGFVLLVEPSS